MIVYEIIVPYATETNQESDKDEKKPLKDKRSMINVPRNNN